MAAPSSSAKTDGWWFWILLGLAGMFLTIAAAAIFGVTVREVLLGREIAILIPLTVDYLLIGFGVYLGILRSIRALWNRVSSH